MPIDSWLSSRFGPIKRIRGFRPAHPEPNWWTYVIDGCRTIGLHYAGLSNNAQGTALTERAALKRALAEAIERYACANSFESSKVCVLKAEDSAIYARLPRCAESERSPDGFKGVAADVLLSHSFMNDLSDDSRVLVPSGFVHMSHRRIPDEPQITIPTSSGAAFQASLPRAILAGLCEVAERDASMSFWLLKKPAARINFAGCKIPPSVSERLNCLENTHVRVTLFDLSTDFPFPIVLCVLSSRTYPFWSFGTACDADLEASLTRAIDEAVAVRFRQRNNKEKPQVVSNEEFDWVRNFTHHAELYASWADCPVLEFFMNSDNAVSLSELSGRYSHAGSWDMGELSQLSRRLASRGLTVLWADLTTDDIEEYGVCVKVVVPEMIPLSVDHAVRWLASGRLNSEKKEVPASQFNRYPHPFG